MKKIDRRTCALLRAAVIEAEWQRKPTLIDGFVSHDRREYGQSLIKEVKMTPAELDHYLGEKAKEWGRSLKPIMKMGQQY